MKPPPSHVSRRTPVVLAESSAPADEAVVCCIGAELPAVAAENKFEIQWMPAGRRTISAFIFAGQAAPAQVTLTVEKSDAEVVQASLEAHLAAGRTPWFDFFHEGKLASGYPEKFFWRDGEKAGIYCVGTYTAAGANAVRNREVRYFSPQFAWNKQTGRIVGIPRMRRANAGGLVNDPAFEDILPVWAKSSGTTPGEDDQPKGTPAVKKKYQFVKAHGDYVKGQIVEMTETEAAAAVAAQAAVLCADGAPPAQPQPGDDVAALRAERDRLLAEKAQLNKATAEAAVQAACSRGAIAPKDEAMKQKWLDLITADPSNAVLLEALPGRVAAGRVVQAAQAAGRVEITREDIKTVLAAYGGEQKPSDKGAIYARDIRPRLLDGEPLPIAVVQADNSLGTLAGDLISQRALDLLVEEFPGLEFLSTNFSDQEASLGQVVRTRLLTVPTVGTYSPSEGYPDTAATASDVPVTIDAHKCVQLAFNANELASTSRRLLDEFAEPAAYAMAEDLFAAVYALFTPANFPSEVIEPLDAFDRKSVGKLRKAQSALKAPKFRRSLLLNPDYYAKLGEDESVVSVAVRGANRAIETGDLPMVGGYQPFEAVSLPTANNLVGVAAQASAVAVAARVPNDYTQAMPDVPSGAAISVVREPRTGLSLMVVRFIDNKAAVARHRVAWMRGQAKGNPSCATRLISAARS